MRVVVFGQGKRSIIHTTIMKESPGAGSGYPSVVIFGHIWNPAHAKKRRDTKDYMAYWGIAVMNAVKSRSRWAKGAFTWWWCPPNEL